MEEAKTSVESTNIEVKTIGLVHKCADGKNTLDGMWHASFQEIRWRLTSDKFKYCPFCAVALPIMVSAEYTFYNPAIKSNQRVLNEGK